jgi:DeoR family transcriptional regulator, fructose operon transcriptional repressor
MGSFYLALYNVCKGCLIMAKQFFTAERQQSIIKLLKEDHRLTVADLSVRFDITPATVRRQLNKMEKKGLLMRTHGGAIGLEEANLEHSLEAKSVSHVEDKRIIARCARQFIQPGDVIILGGGTTVMELARLLGDVKDLIVITDSLPAATELYQNKDIEVQLCGGTVREKTGVIIGATAMQYLQELRATKTFIGADSISIQHGITTPNRFEAEVESQLVRCGKTVFVLADSSKMDRITLARQTPLKDLDYIITDSGINPAFLENLRANCDAKVVVANR